MYLHCGGSQQETKNKSNPVFSKKGALQLEKQVSRWQNAAKIPWGIWMIILIFPHGAQVFCNVFTTHLNKVPHLAWPSPSKYCDWKWHNLLSKLFGYSARHISGQMMNSCPSFCETCFFAAKSLTLVGIFVTSVNYITQYFQNRG